MPSDFSGHRRISCSPRSARRSGVERQPKRPVRWPSSKECWPSNRWTRFGLQDLRTSGGRIEKIGRLAWPNALVEKQTSSCCWSLPVAGKAAFELSSRYRMHNINLPSCQKEESFRKRVEPSTHSLAAWLNLAGWLKSLLWYPRG